MCTPPGVLVHGHGAVHQLPGLDLDAPRVELARAPPAAAVHAQGDEGHRAVAVALAHPRVLWWQHVSIRAAGLQENWHLGLSLMPTAAGSTVLPQLSVPTAMSPQQRSQLRSNSAIQWCNPAQSVEGTPRPFRGHICSRASCYRDHLAGTGTDTHHKRGGVADLGGNGPMQGDALLYLITSLVPHPTDTGWMRVYAP